ncbi:hypothetical protein OSB04_011191 [Centaurea solstitialis]|uniref:Reverse transcriptase Ty1/copia-type domain-containing protein n=1 Tax=Centaurea solstitialis TaxID=347529 RepID=A0AA38WDG7_9ASTR|nr:hypothetical protein OSB04_011191 [Centaurea solstitialis]
MPISSLLSKPKTKQNPETIILTDISSDTSPTNNLQLVVHQTPQIPTPEPGPQDQDVNYDPPPSNSPRSEGENYAPDTSANLNRDGHLDAVIERVETYLYGDLDTEIYMRATDGLKLLESSSSQPRDTFSIRLRRSLYGLKQLDGYGYAIITVYVDDMNLIGTSKELLETAEILKKEFEMKDLGKTWCCLGLQIEHRRYGILIHQENYNQKVLRRFCHHDAKSSSTPMIICSLDIKKDPFHPKEDDEEILSLECSYLGAIGALLYLAQCTRPNISYAENCLARHSNEPTCQRANMPP